MKRYLLTLLAFTLLTIPCAAWGASLYVAQTAAGDGTGSSYANRASVATFNAASGNFADLAGDTVYFSGAITTTIVVPVSGTAGNYITLDGDDDVNTAATIDPSGSYSIGLVAKSYIIIRDFTISTGDEGIYTQTSGNTGCTYIQIISNTFTNVVNRPIFISNGQDDQATAYYGIIGDDGDGILEAGELLVANQHISITDNTIANCGNNTASYSMKIDGVVYAYIARNHIYGSTTNWGVSQISGHGARNVLVEYNTIHDLSDSTDEATEVGLTTGKGGYNWVIRFNNVYNIYATEAVVLQGYTIPGISIWGDTKYIYVYGNRIYNNNFGLMVGESGPSDAGCGDGISPQYIYLFSNLIYENHYMGIGLGSTGECSAPYQPADLVKDTFIYNNTIVRNGGWDSSWDEGYFLYGSNVTVFTAEDLTMKNNLIVEGRPYKTNYVQVGSSGTTYPNGTVDIDDNQYYWPGQSSAFTLKATQANFAAWQSAGYDTNGLEADPLFYDDDTDDFRLNADSGAIDTATTITALNALIPITDGAGTNRDVTITLSEALDPVNTDWTTTPPTVKIVMRPESTWDRGAYEMGESINYPNGTIDAPASGTTLTTGTAYAVLGTAESGTTPYTYAWTFDGSFIAYNAGTEYNTGSTVTYDSKVWRSLQDTHTGNTPAEDAYWTRIDNDEDPCPAAAKCIFATAGSFEIMMTVTDNASLADPTPALSAITVAGSGYTCDIDVSQPNHNGYWNNSTYSHMAQKIKYVSNPGPICKVKARLYLNSGSPTAHVEIWPTADKTGSQIGGDSSICSVITASTPGELYEFTWDTDYPTPTGDYWIHIVQDAAGTYSVRVSTTVTDYEDGDYSLWRSGAELSPKSDLAFELYARAGSAPPASEECTLTVDQTTNDTYCPVSDADKISQKIKFASNPGPICKAYVQLYPNSGSPTAHLEIWTDADRAGTQIGGDSDTCSAITVSTPGEMKEFTWSANYPTPSGDYFIHLVQDAAGTYSVRITADETAYEDTNYDFYRYAAEPANDWDMTFKLHELTSTPYVVQTVTAITQTGYFKEADEVGPFTVTFNGLLDWDEGTGTISLVLNNTAGDDPSVRISSASGTDSSTLIFDALTVPAAMASTDLDAVSITLTGDAYIRNANTATTDATLTLPTGATAGSLAGGSAILVDTTSDTQTSWTGVTTDSATFTAPTDVIDILLTLPDSAGYIINAEPTWPRVALSMEYPDSGAYAYFVEKVTNQTYKFRIYLADGYRDSDGITMTGDLLLSDGTFSDQAGNAISVSLPASPNAIEDDKTYIVAIPFSNLQIGTSGTYATMTATKSATPIIPGDHFSIGTVTEPGALDLSGDDGGSGTEITITLEGDWTITGALTLGDYTDIVGAGNTIDAATYGQHGVGSSFTRVRLQ